MTDIKVVNIFHKPKQYEYIGRPGKGQKGSPLANPRRLGADKPEGGAWERGETIALYEKELRTALDRTATEAFWNGKTLSSQARNRIRAEMNRLFLLAQESSTGSLQLACFCAPKACHGDIIKKLLEEALAQQKE